MKRYGFPILLVFVIGGPILLYSLWQIRESNDQSKAAQETLTSLCSHPPDDYWDLRTGLLQHYPIGSKVEPLLVVAGSAMKTVAARDDFDVTRLVLAKRPEDTRRNARHYIFQHDCPAKDEVSVRWQLSVLSTLDGEMVAIALIPVVPLKFYSDKRHFLNLDFPRSNDENQTVLRRLLPRGMPISEAIAVMKQLGEIGRYGKLQGPTYIEKGRTVRYDYTFARDIGVSPRVALEDIKIVIIFELDQSDSLTDVKVP